ncbi:MAG TPA: cytosine permease [Phycisphaerae bacterium]|nr:cytosine permease [Phycisphaerae bacterium]
MANGKLPGYLASAVPNPAANRTPWYKNTAQTYAGIMLWFVFWHEIPMGSGLGAGGHSASAGGTLAQGLGVAFLGLILAALICHFLFYMVPGMLGMKTGLPLYIVGTSTYGATGGFLMPGFLMGLLQFGWLAVNAFFAGILLCAPFGYGFPSVPHAIVAAAWVILGAFMGLKGIKYVARVATFLPLLPLAILAILLVSTIGGLGNFEPKMVIDAGQKVVVDGQTAGAPLGAWAIIVLLCTYVVGFFATAGAAGTDFGMNNRNAKDVHLGGLVGIALATVVAGGLALLVVAGAYGAGKAGDGGVMQTTGLMGDIMGTHTIMGIPTASIFWYLLAIAAFPPACFSSFIAANSFKTTLPKVNPWISVGAGALVAIILAVTGWAGNAIGMFQIIGASFGPVCGAMMADYLLAGRKWAGPRAGFNPAGWISWIIGFAVGAADFIPGLAGKVPCPPVAAFIVGFILYVILAKIGLQSRTLQMPGSEAPQQA